MLSVDMRHPMALKANRKLRNEGQNTVLELENHGEVPAHNVRFSDRAPAGHLLAYIRQEASEHKVVTAVIAIGVVAAGLYSLKHRQE